MVLYSYIPITKKCGILLLYYDVLILYYYKVCYINTLL